jgi:hypothetical protein
MSNKKVDHKHRCMVVLLLVGASIAHQYYIIKRYLTLMSSTNILNLTIDNAREKIGLLQNQFELFVMVYS